MSLLTIVGFIFSALNAIGLVLRQTHSTLTLFCALFWAMYAGFMLRGIVTDLVTEIYGPKKAAK